MSDEIVEAQAARIAYLEDALRIVQVFNGEYVSENPRGTDVRDYIDRVLKKGQK